VFFVLPMESCSSRSGRALSVQAVAGMRSVLQIPCEYQKVKDLKDLRRVSLRVRARVGKVGLLPSNPSPSGEGPRVLPGVFSRRSVRGGSTRIADPFFADLNVSMPE
jgi:hypothetical protein